MKRPSTRRTITPNKIIVLDAVCAVPGLSILEYSKITALSFSQTRRILYEWQGLGELKSTKGWHGALLWHAVGKSG